MGLFALDWNDTVIYGNTHNAIGLTHANLLRLEHGNKESNRRTSELNSVEADGKTLTEEAKKAQFNVIRHFLPTGPLKLDDLLTELRKAGVKSTSSYADIFLELAEQQNTDKNNMKPEEFNLKWGKVNNLLENIRKVNSAAWRDAIRQIIADGHQIVIVSFNSYPNIILDYLKEIIGLTDEELKKVKIYTEYPLKENKNHLISRAKHEAQLEPLKSDIVYCDDNSKYKQPDKSLPYSFILAEQEHSSHLEELKKQSTELKELEIVRLKRIEDLELWYYRPTNPHSHETLDPFTKRKVSEELANYYALFKNTHPRAYLKWTVNAAKEGHPQSLFNLAMHYQEGQYGLQKSLSNAVILFYKVIETNDIQAIDAMLNYLKIANTSYSPDCEQALTQLGRGEIQKLPDEIITELRELVNPATKISKIAETHGRIPDYAELNKIRKLEERESKYIYNLCQNLIDAKNNYAENNLKEAAKSFKAVLEAKEEELVSDFAKDILKRLKNHAQCYVDEDYTGNLKPLIEGKTVAMPLSQRAAEKKEAAAGSKDQDIVVPTSSTNTPSAS